MAFSWSLNDGPCLIPFNIIFSVDNPVSWHKMYSVSPSVVLFWPTCVQISLYGPFEGRKKPLKLPPAQTRHRQLIPMVWATGAFFINFKSFNTSIKILKDSLNKIIEGKNFTTFLCSLANLKRPRVSENYFIYKMIKFILKQIMIPSSGSNPTILPNTVLYIKPF